MPPRHVWVDGRLLPAEGPHLSAFDRGFQLGDGVFETLRARGGRRPRGLIVVRQTFAAALLVLALSAACGTAAETGPLIVPLPARTIPPGNFGCAGVGHEPEPVLRGDPGLDPPIWAEFGGGHRAPIVWPPGYVAVFDPALIVMDAEGRIVAREGTSLEEGPGNDWPGLFVCAGLGEVWIWEDPA